jgi:rSAM/selenodomain-associated transferase 2
LRVSIVIPAINEAAVIRAAIDRAWAAGADEVIVADGGSEDDTVAVCRAANCKWVQSEPGRGVQLNAGAAESTGDLLLFLHADNWLTCNGVEQIRSAFENSSSVFGGFHQRIENEGRSFRWIESGNAARVRWRGLVYGDQAMFVSKSIFDAVGGFADICLMEDLDLSRRVKKLVWPRLLAGPTYVDARRWEATGPLRQTIRNWCLAGAFMVGAKPESLAKRYRRHDD